MITEKRLKDKPIENENPLVITVREMENELAEIEENNMYLRRIQQLEKELKEAEKQAEALTKTSQDFGISMDELGENTLIGVSVSKPYELKSYKLKDYVPEQLNKYYSLDNARSQEEVLEHFNRHLIKHGKTVSQINRIDDAINGSKINDKVKRELNQLDKQYGWGKYHEIDKIINEQY